MKHKLENVLSAFALLFILGWCVYLVTPLYDLGRKEGQPAGALAIVFGTPVGPTLTGVVFGTLCLIGLYGMHMRNKLLHITGLLFGAFGAAVFSVIIRINAEGFVPIVWYFYFGLAAVFGIVYAYIASDYKHRGDNE